jgi:hypothetical protein
MSHTVGQYASTGLSASHSRRTSHFVLRCTFRPQKQAPGETQTFLEHHTKYPCVVYRIDAARKRMI